MARTLVTYLRCLVSRFFPVQLLSFFSLSFAACFYLFFSASLFCFPDRCRRCWLLTLLFFRGLLLGERFDKRLQRATGLNTRLMDGCDGGSGERFSPMWGVKKSASMSVEREAAKQKEL